MLYGNVNMARLTCWGWLRAKWAAGPLLTHLPSLPSSPSVHSLSYSYAGKLAGQGFSCVGTWLNPNSFKHHIITQPNVHPRLSRHIIYVVTDGHMAQQQRAEAQYEQNQRVCGLQCFK